MPFMRTVKLRTVQYYNTGNLVDVTLDSDSKVSAVRYNAIGGRKQTGPGSLDVPNMSSIYLLPRWNAERLDGSVLSDRKVPQDRDLSTAGVQDGDIFDLVANPEVFACTCVIAGELRYAYERFVDQDAKATCPRCGNPTAYDDVYGFGNWHCAPLQRIC